MVLMVLSQYLLLFLIQLTEGIHEIHEERKCSKTKGTQKPSFINLVCMYVFQTTGSYSCICRPSCFIFLTGKSANMAKVTMSYF